MPQPASGINGMQDAQPGGLATTEGPTWAVSSAAAWATRLSAAGGLQAVQAQASRDLSKPK